MVHSFNGIHILDIVFHQILFFIWCVLARVCIIIKLIWFFCIIKPLVHISSFDRDSHPTIIVIVITSSRISIVINIYSSYISSALQYSALCERYIYQIIRIISHLTWAPDHQGISLLRTLGTLGGPSVFAPLSEIVITLQKRQASIRTVGERCPFSSQLRRIPFY